jgi:hypothetical protein
MYLRHMRLIIAAPLAAAALGAAQAYPADPAHDMVSFTRINDKGEECCNEKTSFVNWLNRHMAFVTAGEGVQEVVDNSEEGDPSPYPTRVMIFKSKYDGKIWIIESVQYNFDSDARYHACVKTSFRSFSNTK